MGLGRKKANTVLLLGPCGSGKTVLYHQVIAASCPHSHQVATETLSLDDDELRTPGCVMSFLSISCRQLLHGVAPETVTSMKESESQASVTKASGAPVSYALVDFPGHERLRG